MSWDKYISDQLVATGHVNRGAICGLDGAVWATSEGINITQAQAAILVKAFNDPSSLSMTGILIGADKYFFLSGNDEILRGKIKTSGVHIAKTNMAIVIGIYVEPTQPGQCAIAVENLAEYLKGQNY